MPDSRRRDRVLTDPAVQVWLEGQLAELAANQRHILTRLDQLPCAKRGDQIGELQIAVAKAEGRGSLMWSVLTKLLPWGLAGLGIGGFASSRASQRRPVQPPQHVAPATPQR